MKQIIQFLVALALSLVLIHTFHDKTSNSVGDVQSPFKGFDTFINKNHFLDNSKVRAWMEGVVTKTMNEFGKDANNRYILKIERHGDFYVKINKSGPAFTLKATGNCKGEQILLDIDLVPCFLFQQVDWPKGSGYIPNPVSSKTTFFVVPKPMKGGTGDKSQYWRLSFQEQERLLLDNKGPLKPAIRFLKKMRDYLKHNAIASYYIKIVALHMAATQSPDFWKNPLSYVFMTLLKEYQKCLENKKIIYYWNRHFNLIENINATNLSNISCKLKNIIEEIEKNPQDPKIVAKYLISPQEMNRLM